MNDLYWSKTIVMLSGIHGRLRLRVPGSGILVNPATIIAPAQRTFANVSSFSSAWHERTAPEEWTPPDVHHFLCAWAYSTSPTAGSGRTQPYSWLEGCRSEPKVSITVGSFQSNRSHWNYGGGSERRTRFPGQWPTSISRTRRKASAAHPKNACLGKWSWDPAARRTSFVQFFFILTPDPMAKKFGTYGHRSRIRRTMWQFFFRSLKRQNLWMSRLDALREPVLTQTRRGQPSIPRYTTTPGRAGVAPRSRAFLRIHPHGWLMVALQRAARSSGAHNIYCPIEITPLARRRLPNLSSPAPPPPVV